LNSYRIEIDKLALKFLVNQPLKQRERILKAIYVLPLGDIKEMKGYDERYRLRVGSYRVIYEINNHKLTILVTIHSPI
jgi:mRNA interferase RelE/StbE